MVTELMPGVYWVGAVDWGIRTFHGHEYSTHRGTTYNAYLIVDDQIALVDTVWGPFTEELLANIRQVVDPARINYMVANHAEMDHSGGLPAVMRAAPGAQVLVSPRGAASVEGHYHEPWRFQAVRTGESVSLGQTSMVFIEAPMLHWPDSMFTYLQGRALLMPNDAFGQHYATAFR
ncbi:MAG: MBL fold metallo-hydrolase, partial [Chloroflexota bacterium]